MPVKRALLPIYLMAESDVEQGAINQRFWQHASTLDCTHQILLRGTLKHTFLKLLVLVVNLRERVVLANA